MRVKLRRNKKKGLEDVQENEELQKEIPETPQDEQMPQAEETPAEQTEESKPSADEKELEKARAQAEEYLNLAQRVQADFDNFRRRNSSVRADAYAEGQRNVAASMLGVLDNLERALESAPEESALRSGVELTLKGMREVYEK